MATQSTLLDANYLKAGFQLGHLSTNMFQTFLKKFMPLLFGKLFENNGLNRGAEIISNEQYFSNPFEPNFKTPRTKNTKEYQWRIPRLLRYHSPFSHFSSGIKNSEMLAGNKVYFFLHSRLQRTRFGWFIFAKVEKRNVSTFYSQF